MGVPTSVAQGEVALRRGVRTTPYTQGWQLAFRRYQAQLSPANSTKQMSSFPKALKLTDNVGQTALKMRLNVDWKSKTDQAFGNILNASEMWSL